ncbi:hypothetical protein ACQKII_24000 [Lysinibacillus sp. NPDC048646]|uniref:hypothetical protein n=1 Tax=Lysinibacillus sp. NPDC048646 TaxID=3390574 RepID=UPI003D077684
MDFKETKDEVIIKMKSSQPTEEELLSVINQTLKDDNWIQETPYTSDMLRFNKTKIPDSLLTLLQFAHEIKKGVKDNSTEVFHWEQKGLYCVYMSILIKVMYEKIDKENADNLDYYQGAYKMQNGKYTLHGWLNYGGMIIDVTAAGQHDILIGCKEPQETIEKYLNRFAGEYGISIEKWLEPYFSVYADFLKIKD